MNVDSIVQHFQIKGSIRSAIPFGNGHINDTFHLINMDALHDDYLLQRINHQIFKDVAGIMNNIQEVSSYLNIQFQKNHSNYTSLTLIPTADGRFFHQDEYGNYWRIYVFMKNLMSYDIAKTETQIYEGAKAFGHVLAQLDNFPITKLVSTIPNFHHVGARLRTFRSVIKTTTGKRTKEAATEIKYVLRLADQMCQIERLGEAGQIPLRVTHNDTKFNNVLLDKNGKGKVVVDLDTMMPGYVHYDFGDGIRTTVSMSVEDEEDLKNIQVDMKRYQAFATGYLDATHSILRPKEIEYLPLAGPLLAYIMGLRFLTDYLAGDIYYKTHFEKQNFQRAKAQLNLCKKLMEQQADLKVILRACLKFFI